MEPILLSLFGIASLFVLEFFGLLYERRLSESHLSSAELHASPSGNQTAAPLANQFLRVQKRRMTPIQLRLSAADRAAGYHQPGYDHA